jgi:hypothetical protein
MDDKDRMTTAPVAYVNKMLSFCGISENLSAGHAMFRPRYAHRGAGRSLWLEH